LAPSHLVTELFGSCLKRERDRAEREGESKSGKRGERERERERARTEGESRDRKGEERESKRVRG
jgi:hypothetical protein